MYIAEAEKRYAPLGASVASAMYQLVCVFASLVRKWKRTHPDEG